MKIDKDDRNPRAQHVGRHQQLVLGPLKRLQRALKEALRRRQLLQEVTRTLLEELVADGLRLFAELRELRGHLGTVP